VRREKEIHLHIITYSKYIYGHLTTYIRNSISFFFTDIKYSKVFVAKDALDAYFAKKSFFIKIEIQITIINGKKNFGKLRFVRINDRILFFGYNFSFSFQ